MAFETGVSLPQNIDLNAVCTEVSANELLSILTLLCRKTFSKRTFYKFMGMHIEDRQEQ
jgi:hypothetical protein